MNSETATIQDVSDTALWVAHYRAVESARPDALFNDRLAKALVGDRGAKIADSMKSTSLHVQWSVVIRTRIIDSYIQNLVREGVDTVINLGAGLDTRPYRLKLPSELRWIEVDYPHLIAHKENILKNEKPVVTLERVSLDLSDRKKRKELFAKLGSESKKALVLTEGVIIYLNEKQVAELAEDLLAEKSFVYWITEYISSFIYRYFRSSERMKQLKNAPFQFFPTDWFGFFKNLGWAPHETKYVAEEGEKLGRPGPLPWFAYLLKPFLNKETQKKYQRQMGYVLWSRR